MVNAGSLIKDTLRGLNSDTTYQNFKVISPYLLSKKLLTFKLFYIYGHDGHLGHVTPYALCFAGPMAIYDIKF